MATETQKNNLIHKDTAIWCITPNGKLLGQQIQRALDQSTLFVSNKQGQDLLGNTDTIIFQKLSEAMQTYFGQFKKHIFLFSTGIAIRIIAPLLISKTSDPAVVVVDDNATFAISLLSGHIGGANLLANDISEIINATPVITTATDTNHLPSIDMIAKEALLQIETPQNIKHINMAFLMNRPVTMYDPFNLTKERLPEKYWVATSGQDIQKSDVFCSYETAPVPRETLILRPPILSVGVGCNRNTSVEEIQQFMLSVLKEEGLSLLSVCKLATTDVKADEKGLLSLSEKLKIPLDFYTKQELSSVTTIKTPSDMVEKHLGIKSVCEAAAILSANHGPLIVTKKKNKDVTIAVAIVK